MIEGGLTTKRSVILGLVLGWLVLTKYTGLAAYPACAVGFSCAAWLHQVSARKFLVQAAITAATTIASCIWWFIRTAIIFPGDLMGTKTMFHTWAITYHKSLTPDISAWAVIKQKNWWLTTIFSFWGMFGYMTRQLRKAYYWIYIGFMIISLLGGCTALTMQINRWGKNGAWRNIPARPTTKEQEIRFKTFSTWLVLATCFLSNIGMMIYASTKNLGGAQGRYLFPSEIPIMAIILGGLYLIGPKPRKILILSLVAYNILVYFVAFRQLAPAYGFHFFKTY